MTPDLTAIQTLIPEKYRDLWPVMAMVVLPWITRVAKACREGDGIIGGVRSIFYGSKHAEKPAIESTTIQP